VLCGRFVLVCPFVHARANTLTAILGQRDILQSLLEFASDKERSAAEIALAQGIELVFEDGELIEGEESDSGQYDDA